MSWTAALPKNFNESCPTCWNVLNQSDFLLLDLKCYHLAHSDCVLEFFKQTGRLVCPSCNQEGEFILHQRVAPPKIPCYLGPISIHSNRLENPSLLRITIHEIHRITTQTDSNLEIVKFKNGRLDILYFDSWNKQYKRFEGSSSDYLFKRSIEHFVKGTTAWIIPLAAVGASRGVSLIASCSVSVVYGIAYSLFTYAHSKFKYNL